MFAAGIWVYKLHELYMLPLFYETKFLFAIYIISMVNYVWFLHFQNLLINAITFYWSSSEKNDKKLWYWYIFPFLYVFRSTSLYHSILYWTLKCITLIFTLFERIQLKASNIQIIFSNSWISNKFFKVRFDSYLVKQQMSISKEASVFPPSWRR